MSRLCSSASDRSASAHPQLGSKFLAALNGGTIDLHGEARTSWVPLGNSTAPGHDTLRLAQPVDWRAGERVAIASGADHCLLEERSIDDVGTDCLTVRLAKPVWHRHHGKHAPLRHVLPGSIGKVVLLSRNIVIEGCADSERNSVGAYCMIAGTADNPARHSIGRFSGVEFRRMGQFNRPGRYPLHWHDNGDAADSSVVGCLIHQSYQRGIVTVGSRHVRISGNVVMKPFRPRLHRRKRRQLAAAGDDKPGAAPARCALRRSENAQLLRASAARILDRAVCHYSYRAFTRARSDFCTPVSFARAAAGAACRRRTS